LSAVLFTDLDAVQWLLPLSAPFLLTLVSRLMEYLADELAADLGYGPALREAFYGWQAERFKRAGVQSRRFGLLDGSPAVESRIRALDRRLESS
jgi:Zn-dependent protease with chaperone function